MARNPPSYLPGLWEKITVTIAALVTVAFVLLLGLRNEPFRDPNLVVMVRTILSLGIAALGAAVPGFLHVDLSSKGLAVRAGGALALFVLTFFFTPTVVGSNQRVDRGSDGKGDSTAKPEGSGAERSSPAPASDKTAELHLDAVRFDKIYGDYCFDVLLRNTGNSVALATSANIRISDVKFVRPLPVQGHAGSVSSPGSMAPSGDYSAKITPETTTLTVPIAQEINPSAGGRADRFRILVAFKERPDFLQMDARAEISLTYNGDKSTPSCATSFSLPSYVVAKHEIRVSELPEH